MIARPLRAHAPKPQFCSGRGISIGIEADLPTTAVSMTLALPEHPALVPARATRLLASAAQKIIGAILVLRLLPHCSLHNGGITAHASLAAGGSAMLASIVQAVAAKMSNPALDRVAATACAVPVTAIRERAWSTSEAMPRDSSIFTAQAITDGGERLHLLRHKTERSETPPDVPATEQRDIEQVGAGRPFRRTTATKSSRTGWRRRGMGCISKSQPNCCGNPAK